MSVSIGNVWLKDNFNLPQFSLNSTSYINNNLAAQLNSLSENHGQVHKGVFPKRRREEFSKMTDDEIKLIEVIYKNLVELQ